MQRTADQAQLSATLAMRMADRDPIRHLQQWVPDHLDSVRGVEDLARLANMSPRNFSRWFRKETGGTPAAWLRSVRLEAAKHRLRESRAPVARVAEHTGFGGARTLRRALHEQGQTATKLRRGSSNST